MGHKLISQLSSASTVVDADLIEVQKSGESITKKASVSLVTETERTARAAQDDVIELAVGLNTDGTYPTNKFDNSWYLRTADHQEIVDRAGTSFNLPSDIVNALRILDYRVHNVLDTVPLTSEVDISHLEAIALFSVPKLLIECPSQTENKYFFIEVLSCVGVYINGSIDYTANDDLQITYGSGSVRASFPHAQFMGCQTTEEAYTIYQAEMQGCYIDLTGNVYASMASNATNGDGGYFKIITTYRVHSVNIL